METNKIVLVSKCNAMENFAVYISQWCDKAWCSSAIKHIDKVKISSHFRCT